MTTPAHRTGLTGRVYNAKGRAKGAAAWRPQKQTVELLNHVKAVLASYAWAITARQIFYRLVGLGVLDKTENDSERLSTMLTRARRSGVIDFSAVADDSLSRYGPVVHDGVDAFFAWASDEAEGHLFADWTEGQAVLPIVWTESDGMASFLRTSLGAVGWPVDVVSTSGSDSVRPKFEAARDAVERFQKTGQRTVFGHIGDYDEAGLSILDALDEDLLAFADGMGFPDALKVEWVALTYDQIVAHALETAPGKTAKYDDDGSVVWSPPGGSLSNSAQAEALDPDDLVDEVDTWLRSHVDLDVLNRRLAVSKRRRRAAQVQLEVLRYEIAHPLPPQA